MLPVLPILLYLLIAIPIIRYFPRLHVSSLLKKGFLIHVAANVIIYNWNTRILLMQCFNLCIVLTKPTMQQGNYSRQSYKTKVAILRQVTMTPDWEKTLKSRRTKSPSLVFFLQDLRRLSKISAYSELKKNHCQSTCMEGKYQPPFGVTVWRGLFQGLLGTYFADIKSSRRVANNYLLGME